MGNSSRGFTIIEVILFLAVTGLLILTFVAGAGTNINIQRYRDAVESFKSDLQSQYANLTSVENSRGADTACGVTAKPVADPNGELRGQSDCMVVGKYLRIEGANIATYTVFAYETSSTVAAGLTDIQVLNNNYAFNVADEPDSDQNLDWGTSLAWQKGVSGPNPRTMGILFVRSPYTGQIYTFTTNTVVPKNSVTSATLTSMMIDDDTIPGRHARVLCIESDGLFVNDNQSIIIGKNASGPTSIEAATNSVITAKGLGVEC